MWWVSAPQQPAPSATTTSQPIRVSRRIVASLISVFNAFCAQPVISATRFFFGAVGAKLCGSSLRLTGGITLGAISSIARRRGSGISPAKGAPILASSSATRNRIGYGKMRASIQRSTRSDNGRS